MTEKLPPIILAAPRSVRIQQVHLLPRLGRLACVLVALALPVLGIAVADMVHRAGANEAVQAAAPVAPSDGAAAPSIPSATLASLIVPDAPVLR